jgi:type II secretory pathway component PulF
MDFAYTYTAKTSRGKLMTGTVYAPNKVLGYARLKKNGFKPLTVELNLMESLRNLTGGQFNALELARFYNTLGRRMNNGKPLVEGLEAAVEYVQDEKLKQAILVMRQATLDGQNEHRAMAAAGFPSRDALVIRATSEAGKTGQTFLSLAAEITRVEALRRSVAAIFRMPIIMAFMMYGFFYGALVWVAPMTMKFLKQTNLKMNLNAFNQGYFDFAKMFNENLLLGSICYALVPVGVIFGVRSQAFKNALDHLKRLRMIAVKADQAALWNSFSLLYDAAIPVKEACRIIADAAKRQDSRQSFIKLGRMVEAGRPIEDAVQNCGFPSYIVSGVRSSISGGSLLEGLLDMVKNLEEDVITLTEMMTETVKIVATLMVATGVSLVFFVTYYPIVASVLSNL